LKRRVVITGIGIISSIGTNTGQFWKNCLKGKSVIEKIPRQWKDYNTYISDIWSPLPDLNIKEPIISEIDKKRLDKTNIMAVYSASEALRSAGLKYTLFNEKQNTYSIKSIDSSRSGVFMGTGIGGINTVTSCFSHQILNYQKEALTKLSLNFKEDETTQFRIKKITEKMLLPKRFNPFSVTMIMPNACSANLGIKFNLKGRNNTFCTACASGTTAIGTCYNSIKSGEIDFALAGGTEYMMDQYGGLFYGFDILKTLAHDYDNIDNANCPFDKKRNGFLFSEGGSAVLVIEEMLHAQKRGAEIIAEIRGYEESCDANSIIMMDKSGFSIINMIENVINSAGIKKEHVNYINSHGTGTVLNDEVESEIIEKVFGNRVLVNSTKSLLGHTLGASGAIEAAVTALSIKNKTTHICKNLKEPIRDLNFVTEVREYDIKTAISESFGFGGHNAVLVFSEA
jgi:3-oxoacyl-[acyl-carrier-protein] synthase II